MRACTSAQLISIARRGPELVARVTEGVFAGEEGLRIEAKIVPLAAVKSSLLHDKASLVEAWNALAARALECSSFRDHLAVLRHYGMAEVWDDRRIPAGDEWEAQIDDRLAQADIVLLPVSPAFIASDYCFKRELPAALARRPEAAVIPIVVEPCDFEGLPFEKLQMPRQGKPITEARNR